MALTQRLNGGRSLQSLGPNGSRRWRSVCPMTSRTRCDIVPNAPQWSKLFEPMRDPPPIFWDRKAWEAMAQDAQCASDSNFFIMVQGRKSTRDFSVPLLNKPAPKTNSCAHARLRGGERFPPSAVEPTHRRKCNSCMERSRSHMPIRRNSGNRPTSRHPSPKSQRSARIDAAGSYD